MTFVEYGKIAPVTPGTKVQVDATATDRVHKLKFVQVKGQTGFVYLYGMSAAGSLVLIRQFEPPTATGLLDRDEYGGMSGNRVPPFNFWVDADNAGEGLEVVAEVA